MNIIYTSSDSYSEITGISIVSLLENNKDAENITIYLINNHISNQNKEKIEKLIKKYCRNIVFIDIPDLTNVLDFELNIGRWHISTFYRLFIGDILPRTVTRAIYIDSDTLVRNSLQEIYDIDLQDKIVAGVDDFRSDNYRTNIGLKPESCYINNGFLIIDVEKWRTNESQNKFIDIINKFKGNITYMDQGVSNAVFSKEDKVLLIPPKYNSQTIFHDFNYQELIKLRKPNQLPTEDEYEIARINPVVIHFTTSFYSGPRPWMKNCVHPYASEFDYYKSLSPWYMNPKLDDNRKIFYKSATKILRLLPKKITIFLVSILHSKLYPYYRNLKQNK